MKSIELTLPDEPLYERACAFAKEVYAEELSMQLTHFPEVIFAIADSTKVVGCMGMNRALHSPLFVNDTRLSHIRNAEPAVAYCEQSILALRHFSIGLPLLISVAARYALVHQKDRVVYAAIGVSQKTIKHLGFQTQEYGKVDLDLLPREIRKEYETWYHTFDPMCCFLETHNADVISTALLNRLAGKIMLGPRLHALFSVLEQEAA